MDEPARKRARLRWLTLAEIVGVLALVIAALGFWDSHRERLQEDRQRAQADQERSREREAAAKERQAEQQANAVKLTFLMTGSPDAAGGKVRLQAVHPEQVIQTQTIWFPILIRASSAETTGNPRIEAGWIEGGLRRAAKEPQGRVPVAIQTTFIEDGQTKTDRSIYYLGYSLRSRLVGGPRLELEGLSLARRGVSGDLQAAADGLWIIR